MNGRRIGVLLKKEFLYGSKSYFFVYAIVAPLVGTLLVQLLFGSIFSAKPELGIFDPGNSQIVDSLKNLESINLKLYSDEKELKQAIESGAQDLGIVLPKNFDSNIISGESIKITSYVWGESLLKHRAIIGAVFLNQVRNIAARETAMTLTPVSLGKKNEIPWEDRILPAIVLMAIFISGFAVPATSLVDEKQKRTIGAILTTPVTQIDVFISKGLMGIIVSIFMGISILILNHAFNSQLGLIILLLFLGAIMACCFGLLLGAFMKDISSVYSAIQGLGIIIYGPSIVFMFPSIPKWIGKFSPTYYVMNPIMEIAREGGTWSTVKNDVFILIGIIIVFVAIVGVIANKMRQQEV